MPQLNRIVIGLLVWAVALGVAAVEAPAQAADQNKAAAAEYRVLQKTPDRLLVELPNRMIVLAQQLSTSPVVSAQVWIKTGSIYEQEHVGAGLSHFLEHLLSGGTTKDRTEAQSNAILGSIGAQTNASTSLDNVHYYINTTAPYASQAIDLLSDWMMNSQIKQSEYARERDVIQREFDMGRGEPDRILWKLTQQARYKAHPARHPTIGYIDEFVKISRDEIYDFYQRMYVPNNMVFVVVGDIDKDAVVNQLAGLWSSAPARELPKLSFPVEPAVDQPRTLVDTAAISQPRIRLAWPGTQMAAPGDYALDLLGVILGQGESSRLVRTVRDEQRLVNTIEAYNLSFTWGQGFFGIDADVAVPPVDVDDPVIVSARTSAAIERAKAAILEQVGRLLAGGITPEELARAKRQTLARVIYSAQSAQGLATRMARDIIGTNDPDYLQHYAKAIEGITIAQVHAAADRFLNKTRLISITLKPEVEKKEPQPLKRPADDPKLADLPRKPVLLDNVVILDHLRTLDGVVDNTRSIETSPIQTYVMPNGLRVLVGRSTVVPAVAIQMFHLGGLLADEPGREGLANATSIMRIKGTTTRSAAQIAQQLEDLGADLSARCGYSTQYTQAVCLKEDLPTVMGLLADITLNPTFPDDQWARMQPRLVAAIDREMDDWHGELQNVFRQAYYGSYPWSQTPSGRRSVAASLTAADLRKFYHDHLGASDAVLAVFGDVDADEVVKLVQAQFAAMPTKAPVPFNPSAPAPPTAVLVQHRTDKPLAAVQVGFGPGIARKSPDYAGLQVLARVMSSFPSGWLVQELRGRGPGLAYAVWAYQFTGLEPGYFSLVFNTESAKVPEALARAMSVANRARTELVSDDDLARAKASLLTSEFLYKQTNSQRATDAALNVLYGLGLDEPQHYLESVQRLDATVVQALAELYLRNPVAVVITHEPTPEDVLRKALEGHPQEPAPSSPAGSGGVPGLGAGKDK